MSVKMCENSRRVIRAGFIMIQKIGIATLVEKKGKSYLKIMKTLLTPPFHENSSVLLNNLFSILIFVMQKKIYNNKKTIISMFHE